MPGEFEIIERYFTPRRSRADVLLGVGDDAAVLAAPVDRRLVVALDTIVEGVHFPPQVAATDVGYRALAVNLSDLAAMGAEPSWMTLSLSLPRADEAWLSGFAAGLFELADRHDVALVGGDTVRGPLVVSVQIAGRVEVDRWLTRSGARPGDLLYVSGSLGEAAAGLSLIERGTADDGGAAEHLRRRFLRPQPRIELGRALRRLASAAMDVSDGLLADTRKLCAASGCGAFIEIDALPRSAALSELFDEGVCLQQQLAGGDDYELLFTVEPGREQELKQIVEPQLTRIGVITSEREVRCLRNGSDFDPGRVAGYDHFEQRPDGRSAS
ncbi:MAG TPA: thiamine-phosphate kinase [Steroidobacter sp.]|nr:thiamine-phosphate kinase [Steroidobacteraceae bacterium]HLS80853.1 thiamine-phosphate kinase [Steroidobacter sp.]